MSNIIQFSRPVRGYVRITDIPPSSRVPQQINQSWIGVVVPITATGIKSDTWQVCYIPDPTGAVAALRERDPQAAEWWEYVLKHNNVRIVFDAGIAEPIGDIIDTPWPTDECLTVLKQSLEEYRLSR